MTKKIFSIYKIITVIIVAIVVSVSVNDGNWYCPIACFITAWIFLHVLRGNVNEVMADERDYRIAGKSSELSIRIYTALSVIVGMVLYIAAKENTVLFVVGSVLLYSSGLLMFLYTLLSKIYERKDVQN